MNDSTLQLQIHADEIRSWDPSVEYPGVRLDFVVRLDGSPDWQYLYFTLSPEAHPGKFDILWRKGKKRRKLEYELRSRDSRTKAQGFSGADVLYMLMPDRFADGDTANNLPRGLRNAWGADRSNPNQRHGGDLEGIIGHADYIDSLGITAVWVSPVLENDMPYGSYHGYATTDYYRIDPRFGTNARYAALVDTLHRRGIKTVMDMIFNHCGSDHPWRLAPPSSDWFNFQDRFEQTNYRLGTISDPYASDYDRQLTARGWFVREMPDLNQLNPHLMKYLTQNSIWWIEEAGIDGIRMDTYSYADPDRMAQWIKDVKAQYPDFQIVGECWLGTAAGTQYWQQGSAANKGLGHNPQLEVVMDFPLMLAVRDMAPFKEQTDSWHGLNTIYDHLAQDFVYADPKKVLRFLDNHDTERFSQTPITDLARWKQGVALLLTIPGIPQIYYGTELLMTGTRAGGDGNIRLDMPGGFPGDERDAFTREGRTALENEAFDFISRLCRWRRGNSAIAQGSMKHFLPSSGAYVYQRKSDDREATVIINGTDAPLTLSTAPYREILSPKTEYTDMFTSARYIGLGDKELQLAPRQILILEPPVSGR